MSNNQTLIELDDERIGLRIKIIAAITQFLGEEGDFSPISPGVGRWPGSAERINYAEILGGEPRFFTSHGSELEPYEIDGDTLLAIYRQLTA